MLKPSNTPSIERWGGCCSPIWRTTPPAPVVVSPPALLFEQLLLCCSSTRPCSSRLSSSSSSSRRSSSSSSRRRRRSSSCCSHPPLLLFLNKNTPCSPPSLFLNNLPPPPLQSPCYCSPNPRTVTPPHPPFPIEGVSTFRRLHSQVPMHKSMQVGPSAPASDFWNANILKFVRLLCRRCVLASSRTVCDVWLCVLSLVV